MAIDLGALKPVLGRRQLPLVGLADSAAEVNYCDEQQT